MSVCKICFHSPYSSRSLRHSSWCERHWLRAKPHSPAASAAREPGFLLVLPFLLTLFLFLLLVSSLLLFFPHLSSLLPCLLNEKSCNLSVQFSSIQLLSPVQLFANPWTLACQASLFITNSWSLPKLMSIELVMPSNYLILCHPLLLPTSIFPSIWVFSNESSLRIRWPKYWSFSISSSNEYSGLISFRTDWFDLLAIQVYLMGFDKYLVTLIYHCSNIVCYLVGIL